MSDTTNHLDLSNEEPGSRATVEHIELGGEVFGNKVNVKAVVTAGSELNLALAGSVCAGTLYLVGVHGWWAACGLLLPVAFRLCTRGRPGK